MHDSIVPTHDNSVYHYSTSFCNASSCHQVRSGLVSFLLARLIAEHHIVDLQLHRCKSNISSAANLRIGCWNTNGLTKVKSDLISYLKLDIACISETHGLCDAGQFGIYSEKPIKTDKYSGFALIINNRLSSYIMDSASIGSGIVFCKFSGMFINIVVVGEEKEKT